MFETRKKHLIALALVLGAGAVGGLYAAEPDLARQAFESAQQRLEAQAKAQRKACTRLQGNAREVCEVQAKGSEKVAKAQLEAQRTPGPEAEKRVKFARADAEYDVAKQRCEPLTKRARGKCLARAKHEREAAERLAKVEKVEELAALKRSERREAQRNSGS